MKTIILLGILALLVNCSSHSAKRTADGFELSSRILGKELESVTATYFDKEGRLISISIGRSGTDLPLEELLCLKYPERCEE